MSDLNSLAKRSSRFPVLLITVASLVVLVLLSLLRLPEPSKQGGREKPRTSLRIEADLDQRISRLESQLHDPEPLFLPTTRNAAYHASPDRVLQRPGESQGLVAPKMVFGQEDRMPLSLPSPVALPETPARASDHLDSDRPFLGLVSNEVHPAPLPERRLSVEVLSMEEGKRVGQVALPGKPSAFDCVWQPAQFVVFVNEYGVMSSTGLVQSSGVARVDDALGALLRAEWAGVAWQLHVTPGQYRITVGP